MLPIFETTMKGKVVIKSQKSKKYRGGEIQIEVVFSLFLVITITLS